VAERSATHLVLIPSYNPGAIVYETVRGAREFWDPVWVVVDGSTDGTAEGLRRLAETDPGLRVLVLPKNRGKGAAVLHGISAAAAVGYTHVLTMDSDAQHPAGCIPEFMRRSMTEPNSIPSNTREPPPLGPSVVPVGEWVTLAPREAVAYGGVPR